MTTLAGLKAQSECLCTCVRPNSELSIYDMSDQEHAGRRGYGCGLVSTGFSADRACKYCGGSGDPRFPIRR